MLYEFIEKNCSDFFMKDNQCEGFRALKDAYENVTTDENIVIDDIDLQSFPESLKLLIYDFLVFVKEQIETLDPIKFVLEKLPLYIVFEGHEFEFTGFNDGGTEFRISYSPIGDLPDMWYNSLLDNYCTFLYLHEYIIDLKSFRVALMDCRDFLFLHELLPNDFFQ